MDRSGDIIYAAFRTEITLGIVEYCSMYYVYFLELANNDIYVGFSWSLKQRLKEHADGLVPATARALPIKLKSYVAVQTKEKAMALEKYFKSGSGKAIALKRLL